MSNMLLFISNMYIYLNVFTYLSIFVDLHPPGCFCVSMFTCVCYQMTTERIGWSGLALCPRLPRRWLGSSTLTHQTRRSTRGTRRCTNNHPTAEGAVEPPPRRTWDKPRR